MDLLMLAIAYGVKGSKTKPFRDSGAQMLQEKGEYIKGTKWQQETINH
jgi:hypothetical protein